MFTHHDVEVIRKNAVAFFQMRGDGERGDNFVSFPDIGEETVLAFIGYLAGGKLGFSEEQLEALRAVYMGPVNPRTGERIYNGMPIGSEIYGCGIMSHQEEIPPHFYPFQWVFGMNYDPYDFDFDRDLDRVSEKLSSDMDANIEKLSPFLDAGGKLLMYSGSQDPCVPYPDALGYYLRVREQLKDRTDEFFRYFLLPGREHGICGHGARFVKPSECGLGGDFEALRRWVKCGTAPEKLICVMHTESENEPSREREVYPINTEDIPKNFMERLCSARYLNFGKLRA